MSLSCALTAAPVDEQQETPEQDKSRPVLGLITTTFSLSTRYSLTSPRSSVQEPISKQASPLSSRQSLDAASMLAHASQRNNKNNRSASGQRKQRHAAPRLQALQDGRQRASTPKSGPEQHDSASLRRLAQAAEQAIIDDDDDEESEAGQDNSSNYAASFSGNYSDDSALAAACFMSMSDSSSEEDEEDESERMPDFSRAQFKISAPPLSAHRPSRYDCLGALLGADWRPLPKTTPMKHAEACPVGRKRSGSLHKTGGHGSVSGRGHNDGNPAASTPAFHLTEYGTAFDWFVYGLDFDHVERVSWEFLKGESYLAEVTSKQSGHPAAKQCDHLIVHASQKLMMERDLQQREKLLASHIKTSIRKQGRQRAMSSGGATSNTAAV